MQAAPIPTLDRETNDLRLRTADLVANHIIPAEPALRTGRDRAEVWAKLIAMVKQAGLWAPHLPDEYGGMGLDFLEHAYMNEVLAYAVGAAALFGVVAPNSGNQTILVKYGTEEQKQKWLAAAHRRDASSRASR